MSLPKAIKADIHTAEQPLRIKAGHALNLNTCIGHVSAPETLKSKRKNRENRSGPRRPGSTIQGKPWHTAHFVHIPSSYLQLMLCSPLYFRLLSVRINPPAFTKKNRGSAAECRDKFSILYPTTVGTSRAAIPPPPRHNSSIVPRVPPGPKPRRIPPPLEPACA